MNTIINTTDGDYRMSIIFDKTTQTYLLVFSSVRDNKGRQYTCKSYADAVNRFRKNCLFYGVRYIPPVITEADFLGIPDTVFPTPKKEVVYGSNRA